jgi:hypothetical protein
MVAAISRLASLLKQATSGEGRLPVAKPNPSEAELIRTLVKPTVGLRGNSQPAPFAAPSLPMPAGIVPAQKPAMPQVIDAYRAAIELEEPATAASQEAARARGATEPEAGLRPAPGQAPTRDEAVSGRAQPLPTLGLAVPLQAAPGRPAEVENRTTSRKRATAWAGGSKGNSTEIAVSARALGFGLAAFALLFLVVLVVF